VRAINQTKHEKTCNKNLNFGVFITCFLVNLGFTSNLVYAANSCSVNYTPFHFGQNYEPIPGTNPVDYTSIVTVSCTDAEAVTYTIALGSSDNTSLPFRQMREPNSQDLLNYNFYLDATRQIIWGNGVAGTSVVTKTLKCDPTSPACNETIYGRIAPNQPLVHPGEYVDQIQITLEY
jgi:spore coat protein U-like protein